MKHTRINLIISACVFLSVLAAPGLKSIIKPGHYHPLLEKRRLNSQPEFPNSLISAENFPTKFEAYFQDHFEFRYDWLDIYQDSKYLINESSVDKIIFGAEPGWLFYNDVDDNDVVGDFRNINQFKSEQLTQFVQHLKDKQLWLANQGIEYLYVLAPSKHYIYPEFLPKKYQPINQINLKMQLANELQKHPEINFIDLTPVLIEGKNEQQMFLKNDNHWTDYAANLAQQQLSLKLNNLFPNRISPQLKPWSSFTHIKPHTGDLEQINGTIDLFPDNRNLPDFDLCATTLKAITEFQTNAFATDCRKNLRALVFRDSFFSNLQPFVSEHLGLSHFVWQKMSFETADKHIQIIQPNVVIEEWVDRHLPKLHPPQ